MKAFKKLLLFLICMMLISGCNISKTKKTKQDVDTSSLSQIRDKLKNKTMAKEEENLSEEKIVSDKKNMPLEETQPRSVYQLSTEREIKEYLVGEWVSNQEVLSDYLLTSSDMNCDMVIDEDLKVKLLFYNRHTNEPRGDYQGQISFDNFHENSKGAPDLINIDLIDSDYPGGSFFFKHRTIYDGMRVMSWFFSGNGNCIFDMLADIDNFKYAPEEIIFKKVTGEKSQLSPLKDREFYAVYWGMGPDGQSLWLDEVQWTPKEEYDPDDPYPGLMTLYNDDLSESILYTIAQAKSSKILGEKMYSSEVYFVKTDDNGEIIDFEDAAYKAYIELINEPSN